MLDSVTPGSELRPGTGARPAVQPDKASPPNTANASAAVIERLMTLRRAQPAVGFPRGEIPTGRCAVGAHRSTGSGGHPRALPEIGTGGQRAGVEDEEDTRSGQHKGSTRRVLVDDLARVYTQLLRRDV